MAIHRWLTRAVVVAGLSVTTCAIAQTTAGMPPEEAQAVRQFRELYQKEWAFRLREFPLLATRTGNHDDDDKLAQVGEADQRRRYEFWQQTLTALDDIDLNRLPLAERINAQIFRRQMQSRVNDYRFKAYWIPLNSDTGFHTSIARLPKVVPLQTSADYENYLSRLSQIPRQFKQYRTLMAAGLRQGVTVPQVVLQGRSQAFRDALVEDVENSVYYEPFLQRPNRIERSRWEALQQRAQAIIREAVVPAYRSFADFFEQQYIPGARQSIAAKALPQGEDYYRHQVKHYTTLDITPDAIHQLGIEEVARIRGQMQAIIDELGFDGEFADFLEFLRSDEQFYAQTAQELLMRAAWIAKRADAALPGLISHYPRQPYGVAPVPEAIAPHYTGGRYVPSPLHSTQPAYYWVNTYQLESRPLYVLPALTLHEAVPGHHTQNALAAELGELPEFRRYDYISAYGEGWALYAEYLGVEAGIYQTPYEHFGRLTYEMWRACRLVVDTGMHWKGWSRERAVEFLAGNTALSLHEVNTEVDRYISWPAQALSYKMGELTIKRLRGEAEAALGEAFDLRAFHDAILSHGSVPLPILEQQIQAYIQRAKNT